MSELVDKVLGGLLDYIKDNNLKPGDRLPSERALVDMFSVGRPVIREATRVLSVLDVIDIKNQGGMFVSRLDENSQFESFRLYVQLGQVSLKEILETRLVLEVECIGLAAINITDEQLDTLDKILSSVSVEDAQNFAEADKALHRAIYMSTGNRALQLLASTVSMWSIVSRNITNSFIEVRQVVHTDHLNIAKALHNRDVEASKEAMRQHLMHLNQINAIRDKMKVELSELLDEDTSGQQSRSDILFNQSKGTKSGEIQR